MGQGEWLEFHGADSCFSFVWQTDKDTRRRHGQGLADPVWVRMRPVDYISELCVVLSDYAYLGGGDKNTSCRLALQSQYVYFLVL